MNPIDVLTAFYQNGKNNCATIGIIKLSIAHFGVDNVFKNVTYIEGQDLYNVILQNGTNVDITGIELARLSKQSGFTINENADKNTRETITNTANFCFAVIVKYFMKIKNRTEKESLSEINGTGINSDYAFLNLGILEKNISYLTPNNNGTQNANDFKSFKEYLLYNNNHCVMATFDKYDEYADPTDISQFTKKHRSLFKPGKICWGYKLI